MTYTQPTEEKKEVAPVDEQKVVPVEAEKIEQPKRSDPIVIAVRYYSGNSDVR
jgi:hypothetical protein